MPSFYPMFYFTFIVYRTFLELSHVHKTFTMKYHQMNIDEYYTFWMLNLNRFEHIKLQFSAHNVIVYCILDLYPFVFIVVPLVVIDIFKTKRCSE